MESLMRKGQRMLAKSNSVFNKLVSRSDIKLFILVNVILTLIRVENSYNDRKNMYKTTR